MSAMVGGGEDDDVEGGLRVHVPDTTRYMGHMSVRWPIAVI